MDTIQIRIDAKTKKAAKKIFADLGMDLSTGMKVYLTQVVKHKGIPFRVITENGYTPEHEAEMLRDLEWTKKHGKRYTNAHEMLDDILK